MRTLDDAIAIIRDYHARDRDEQLPRFLFRGQTHDWGSIEPKIARPQYSEEERQLALAVDRMGATVGRAVAGQPIPSPEDGVALLQHYGWPTPAIDLTGTPEVAEYFAWWGRRAEDQSVIYVFDRQALLASGFQVREHAFFVRALNEGGFRHRWLRQDGFTALPKKWRSEASLIFDLLSLCTPTEVIAFPWPEGRVPELADPLANEGDPVPRHLQGVLRLTLAQRLQEPPPNGALARDLHNMFCEVPTLPEGKLTDVCRRAFDLPDDLLGAFLRQCVGEIPDVGDGHRAREAAERFASFVARGGLTDTSWYANVSFALDHLCREVSRMNEEQARAAESRIRAAFAHAWDEYRARMSPV